MNWDEFFIFNAICDAFHRHDNNYDDSLHEPLPTNWYVTGFIIIVEIVLLVLILG